jgi:hypothetical protein
MSGPLPAYSDHQRLLDLWRGRLLEARQNYNRVVTEAKTTTVGNGDTVKTFRAEYLRVLHIFTELVISGKSPEE